MKKPRRRLDYYPIQYTKVSCTRCTHQFLLPGRLDEQLLKPVACPGCGYSGAGFVFLDEQYEREAV